MKYIKLLLISFVFSLIITTSYSEEKADCSKIETNNGSGWLKKYLCKKGSDKLDADGNYKKGTFNLFKKLKKI